MNNGESLKPSDDVNHFRLKFEKRLNQTDINRLDILEKRFSEEIETWKIFDVSEISDGVKNICYVKAVTANHAKVKASLIKNNSSIFITNFYEAKEISEFEIDKRVEEYRKKIKKMELEIEKIQNPI